MSCPLINASDYVIIRRVHEEGNGRLVKVEKNTSFHLGKVRLNVGSLIGSHCESIFEMDKNDRKLVAVTLTDDQVMGLFDCSSGVKPDQGEDLKDNRFVNDDGKSQKLSHEEIESLKSGGLSGSEIITTLIENSSTFKEKNAFGQQKYLKKKKQKYYNFVKVYKPSIRLLCEMYYSQGPAKINNLRIDSLSQMLTMADVRSGGKYIVVDNSMGLVAAAVVDRLVGNGCLPPQHDPGVCIQVFTEPGPVTTWRQSIEALNLPPDVLTKCLCAFQIHKASKLLDEQPEVKKEATDGENGQKADPQEIELPEDYFRDAKRLKLDERAKRKAERRAEEVRAKQVLTEKSIDGLLIVTKSVDPTNILNLLMEFLAPSSPFAVFCNVMQPLVDCWMSIKGKAVQVKLNETWLRRYQVMEGRTRPDMNMSASGGYLLTGIKVVP